ncbi:amino acid adenylation domain-containing protein [Streptomyces sp. NPDC090025]|uniref:amino acid adenylation domain-containing protein n=1 Tax=Streptomyces sp. NPDC090025 TaxID=3365922 RepID=UPI00383934F0
MTETLTSAPGVAGPAPAPARSLCGALAAHAAANPTAVALVDGEQRVTYDELMRAAATIRASFDAYGIGAGRRIGVGLARSWRVVAAIVAVLQHGCTYVPLDPEYPADRLEFMAEDSGLKAVCVDPGAAWPYGAGATAPYRVDVTGARAGAEGGAGPLPAAVPPLPDTPAYLIYTSGSTGRPKGVAVSEKAVLKLFASTDEHFSFGPDDVWTLLHSYNFDFSVWEIWGALLYGGRLVVTGKDTARDPRLVAELVEREGVTVLNQVPSAFKSLVRALDRASETEPRTLPSLRYVIFGGEALDRPSVRRWFEAGYGVGAGAAGGAGRCALVDMYGITEITVHATYALLTPEDVAADTGPTRIGQPLAHLRAAVLDEHDRPVADGTPGQLHLAGPSLALGYAGRPELTEERFPRLALDGAPARWYRTGDLVRRRPGDGELEYLGRIDSQIQLGGFRIELGEIEAVLRRAPGAADAMVAVRTLPGGEPVLAAFVVPADPAAPPVTAELRAHCRGALPAHMVPQRFKAAAALPLTPSGKLDRSADPAPLA